MSAGKGIIAKHAKSSAVLVSLGIHALLIMVAISFVVVTVIQKEELSFKAKPINRPKMILKKLQVPVNVKKKKVQRPKLRQRIVVQPKMSRSLPDIRVPEMMGIKGGLGSAAGGGLGGGGSLGFYMPELEVFGIKSRGEKVFIILDSTPWMMYDELGGIPAYTLIKDELVRILGNLNSTVVFNVAVYGHQTGTYTLFPQLVPANSANISKVKDWLTPLNAVKNGGYGTHTLGAGGSKVEENLAIDPLVTVNHWTEPLMVAMKERADTVFLLANGWGHIFYEKAPAKPWGEAKMAKYKQIQRKAMDKLAAENTRRKKAGKPERVLVGSSVVNEYFPGTAHPPQPELYWYRPKEIAQACVNQRKASLSRVQVALKRRLGAGSRMKKDAFSFNVIQFVPESGGEEEERFKELSHLLNGEYRSIPGLEAIQSSIHSAK